MIFATLTLWNFCGNFYTAHYFCLATFCYNSVRELNNLFAQTALALSTAIDAKDSYTHGHSERVAEHNSVALYQCRGTQFDPDIKIAFLQFLCYEILQIKSHLLAGIRIVMSSLARFLTGGQEENRIKRANFKLKRRAI